MICETCDGEREVWLPDENDGGKHYSAPCPACIVATHDAIRADERAKVEAEIVAWLRHWSEQWAENDRSDGVDRAWARAADGIEQGAHRPKD